MPVINNTTVATGTGLSTAGNGGRKLVRLSNGWLVAVVRVTNPSNARYFYVSKDNGVTFSQLTFSANVSDGDVSITATGTRVYCLISNGANTYSLWFDATTVTNTAQTWLASPDTNQTAIGNVSLAINEAGTELHAAWSSKNATYPNSFNIRYAKGVINGDGSVTWGAVEQITKANGGGADFNNPSIVHNEIEPLILTIRSFTSQQAVRVFKKTGLTSDTEWNWTSAMVYNGASYVQSSPSSLFVPQSINGLANGRLWVAWHGKDATDSAKFNVRVSYSDDGGVTWATPVKLTSGNLYDRQNVSLAADKTGKVFALYEEHQWSPDLDIYMRTFSGGSWGAPVAVAEADPAAESNPSALVDYSLQMTTPPFVFTNATDGIKFSGNFNVGASVSPASGALGNKETATLTAYTVTPEAGSTVTQIVEKVNGVTVNTFNNPASLSRTLTVPTATWDTLAYFATHTASIAVTDSNGATTVTTYTFDKTLGNGASLLEATKANSDSKNRISQKRDALAAQVGLSAGSTFDAISAQLASGTAYKKFQSGVSTVSANKITVNSLSFEPKQIIVFGYASGTTYACMSAFAYDKDNIARYVRSGSNDVITPTANGFTVTATFVNAGTYGWLAFG